jgi:hypothetical protein
VWERRAQRHRRCPEHGDDDADRLERDNRSWLVTLSRLGTALTVLAVLALLGSSVIG